MAPLKTESARQRQLEQSIVMLEYPLIFDNSRWTTPDNRTSASASAEEEAKLLTKKKFFGALAKPCVKASSYF